MNTYIYLLLSVPFLIATAVIYICRKDLRRFILKVGILGGIFGVISESWYFQDYWRPPSLFGVGVPSIEDFLFGFGVVALGIVAPLFILRQKRPASSKHSVRRALLIVGIVVALLIVLSAFFHINSIVSSCIIFVGIAGFGLIQYPHLLRSALISSAALVIIATLTYAVLFLIISPDYLSKYFLLYGNLSAPIYFGFMPLTELVWYFTWGLAVTVIPHLVNSKKRPIITSKSST